MTGGTWRKSATVTTKSLVNAKILNVFFNLESTSPQNSLDAKESLSIIEYFTSDNLFLTQL